MLLFKYEVREKYTPAVLEGEITAKDKTEAFNELVEIYTHELSTDVSELKISLEEVAKVSV